MTSAPLSLFLDFDGTLADIVARPEHAGLPPPTLSDLTQLHQQLDGALALVSGRPIAQIDALLAPLMLPAAGIHGAERRDAAGSLHQVALPPIEPVIAAAQRGAHGLDGVLVEIKSAAVALHYRAAPDHGRACMDLALDIVAHHAGWTAMPGKCVVEIKPEGVHKGAAIATFLDSAPFAQRTPVFAGDDVTDEAGFEAVVRAGGLAIKVGPGATLACYRLPDPPAVRRWISLWAAGSSCLDALFASDGALA